MKRNFMYYLVMALLSLGVWQCSEVEEEHPLETDRDDTWISENPDGPDDSCIDEDRLLVESIVDGTVGETVCDYSVDEGLYAETECKLQKLDEVVEKKILSFGDSLYAVYFKDNSLSKAFSVQDNVDLDKLEESSINLTNGKYKVETLSLWS